MGVNLSGKGMLGGGLRGLSVGGQRDKGGDIDPMSTVANLVDVMLVFACGLMLALIVFYDLDIGYTAEEVAIDEEMQEIDEGEIENLEDVLNASGNSYTELGTVYQDPSTGKMYMLTPEDVEVNTSGSSGSSSDSSSDSSSGSDSSSSSGSSSGSAAADSDSSSPSSSSSSSSSDSSSEATSSSDIDLEPGFNYDPTSGSSSSSK